MDWKLKQYFFEQLEADKEFREEVEKIIEPGKGCNLQLAEFNCLSKALLLSRGKVMEAADLCGVTTTCLNNRCHKYGLSVRKARKTYQEEENKREGA